jgi:hypothetical protein
VIKGGKSITNYLSFKRTRRKQTGHEISNLKPKFEILVTNFYDNLTLFFIFLAMMLDLKGWDHTKRDPYKGSN